MAERDSIESLPAGTLGQYRVRARIGSGGMGDVYDAVHVALDKRVAIKTLRRRFLDDQVVVARFLREGQLASRMRHPNIVDVTDVGVIDGLPCLVMEHLEGETLSQLIRRGPMDLSALVDFLLPILAAVEFAHDHGVLHRDLKPSNIFLARSWNGELHPKVLDFGISKLVHESTEAALTTDSAFVGTPHYASPESVRAEKAVDRRSDQYSMGVILYEGATGVRPFAGKSASFVSMAMAICGADFPPPRAHLPALPEEFERVVLRAMSLNADDRFVGMRQLGAALLPFASDRARVIWAPSFGAESSGDPNAGQPSPATQVLQGTGGRTALVTNPSAPPAHAPHSGTGPAHSQRAWPPSGAHAHPAMQSQTPPSYNGPSTGPQPMYPSGNQPPYVMPAALVHDRTPSFGAGVNSSIQPPAAKKSSTLVALLVLALGAVGVVGIVLSRASAKRAAADADVVPVSAVAPVAAFNVDVQATPTSAVIELDGFSIGSGRLTKQFANDGSKHVLRVSAPGYETLRVEFDATRPPPSVVTLRADGTGVASTTLAGKSAPAGKAKPASAAPAGNSNTHATPPAKGKPDRPRTDNIDPWE